MNNLSNQKLGVVLLVLLGGLGVTYVIPGDDVDANKGEEGLEAKADDVSNGSIGYVDPHAAAAERAMAQRNNEEDAASETGTDVEVPVKREGSDTSTNADDSNPSGMSEGADTSDPKEDSSTADSGASTDASTGDAATDSKGSKDTDPPIEMEKPETPVQPTAPTKIKPDLSGRTAPAQAADIRPKVGDKVKSDSELKADREAEIMRKVGKTGGVAGPRYASLVEDEEASALGTVSLDVIRKETGLNGDLFGVNVTNASGDNNAYTQPIISYVLGNNSTTWVVRVFPSEDGGALGGSIDAPEMKNRQPIGTRLPGMVADPAQVIARASEGRGTAVLQSCHLSQLDSVKRFVRDEASRGVYIAQEFWLSAPVTVWEVQFLTEATKEISVQYFDVTTGRPMRLNELGADQ